jgi:hypothetical protein
MIRRASELIGHLHQTEVGPVNEIRSAPVRELSAQIQEALDIRKEANIWEVVEMKRLIIEAGHKILVRGFGLPDRKSFEDSRIVIVLEEISFREEHKVSRHRRGSPLLRAVETSPWNQCDADPREEVSDARESGVVNISPCLERMRRARISETELP